MRSKWQEVLVRRRVRKNSFVLIFVVLALSVLGVAQAQGMKPLSVAPEQVERVEILYFPERVLVRAGLTPARLEQGYQYRLEIRDVRNSAEWEQLRSLLSTTSVTPSGQSYDHRTAVLLFDQNGRRIASVYFGQWGGGGTINGGSGSIKGGMYQWAKSLLKGITE
jgi:hypothetical protein